MTKIKHLAVINAGSSSIKFALFNYDRLSKQLHGIIENIKTAPVFKIYSKDNVLLKKESFNSDHDYTFFYSLLFQYFNEEKYTIYAVGHRVVHGGLQYQTPVQITVSILKDLKKLNPFAPLHQPYNLLAIELLNQMHPELKQIACFDTAFHRTHPPIADQFALPRALTQSGIQRYGFHGLSYEYIMYALKKMAHPHLNNKIIAAHLGNGASLCAIKHQKSIDSTMGFTALEGLMMGTRCGNLDPGVILYLMDNQKMSYEAISNLLYQESGLLGVSGISANMKILEQDQSLTAQEAIQLFIYRLQREIGALIGVLKGIDLLIFTGGIGENSAYIRESVCNNLKWLGLKIDFEANKQNAERISLPTSKIEVCVIPTNEEWIIAEHSHALLQNKHDIPF